MAIIKLIDLEAGEVEELEDCPDCEGLGGWDASKDCEAYDDWQECQTCGGSGEVPLGGPGDIIDYKRDAFQAGD
jgi:hypothetical protein